MKFEINSANITFSGNFIDFFESINQACSHFGVSYFVVGAFARDVILKNIFGDKSSDLVTRDIDIAIQLDTWENYHDFTAYLKTNCGFSPDKNAYTFISPKGVSTDMLPYGKIETERKLSFPPFSRVINMLGFREVSDACLVVRLDDKIDIKISSVEGIIILKFIAWKDRKPEKVSGKHVRDIALIVNTYFEATAEEIATESSDLFNVEDFDEIRCGARALGRRMRQISNHSNTLIDELTTLFSYILENRDSSLFINQLSAEMKRDYEFCYGVIEALAQGFQEFKIT